MKHSSLFRRQWLGRVVGVAAALTAVWLPFSANGSTWPSKPIKVVVCFPPGNAADVIARSIGPVLSERLGQPIVVENKVGAGGAIGVDAVAKAAPDGYTIGMCSLSPITIMPATGRKLPYDPQRDLAPVLLTNQGAMVLVVKKDSPINSVDDLIKRAKAAPGKLTYASLGPGTVSQMSTEAFKSAAGVQLTEVSYKGSGQALTDLVGGHVDVMLDGVASASAMMAAGNVKALAVTTQKRSSVAPNVITLNESGIPGMKGFDVFGWVGVFAPAGVPQPIVQRLNAEINQIMRDPKIVQRATSAGQETAESNTSTQFRDFIRADLERWTLLAKKLHIVASN